MSDTDFDIGSFSLHELTDDFAELVGIRELPESCRRWEGRVRARRRGHTLRGIHVMETAAESSDLLCTLKKKWNQGNEECGGKIIWLNYVTPIWSHHVQILIIRCRSSSISNINLLLSLSSSWCAQVHDCAESEPGKRQRGSSKKNHLH